MADPVFLITGASSGIGAETARAASQAGYRLARRASANRGEKSGIIPPFSPRSS
jgi:NAD(P)-dependent dehydrogenase (short-subunit alcohol dehydrogenase family)